MLNIQRTRIYEGLYEIKLNLTKSPPGTVRVGNVALSMHNTDEHQGGDNGDKHI